MRDAIWWYAKACLWMYVLAVLLAHTTKAEPHPPAPKLSYGWYLVITYKPVPQLSYKGTDEFDSKAVYVSRDYEILRYKTQEDCTGWWEIMKSMDEVGFLNPGMGSGAEWKGWCVRAVSPWHAAQKMKNAIPNLGGREI